ncbi:high mobility group B protein 15 isoform X2 [Amaranthus tricolor]|uniref:high mobility group B protein 15 isoform X2 n=1 Tax=Amaranthus tricolor TaxID=29722 RepID=UPI00258DB8D2|nr:high mobility group B protein 15 isoform X2 [Amaranthus tricolor]
MREMVDKGSSVYPAPLAKYEEVVADPQLFMATLEKFHATMATKFMIPIIGGQDLDLHKLFVEVTSRGGIDKILREKRWKDVTSAFNFPATATNASFVLRKHYHTLLQEYERIYYFKAKVPTAPSVGCPVIGVIDGKFDTGYLVTVTIGKEKLKGVLYQTSSTNSNQVQQTCSVAIRTTDSTPTTSGALHRRRRRSKSELRKRDPSHPKPNRSGYTFFFSEQHPRLKPLHPGKDREISRMIGELWNSLKDNEKAVYEEKAIKDKERYRMEMEDYRERVSKNQVISDAIPIRQWFPDLDAEMEGVKINDYETFDYENNSSQSESEDDEEITAKDDEEFSVTETYHRGFPETSAGAAGEFQVITGEDELAATASEEDED